MDVHVKSLGKINCLGQSSEWLTGISGVITSTQISWFIRFGNTGYNCVYPDGGNIVVVD